MKKETQTTIAFQLVTFIVLSREVQHGGFGDWCSQFLTGTFIICTNIQVQSFKQLIYIYNL